MPVARPLYLDVDGEIPFLVTEFIPGESRFAPKDLPGYCDQLAQILSTIHDFDIVEHDLAFLPAQPDLLAKELSSTATDTLGIRQAMNAALPHISMNATALQHGDYWLGNLLWNGNDLAAIIDWGGCHAG